MICIDASLAAKLVFEEEHYEIAQALYADSVAAGQRVLAPHLLPLEVTNIMRQRMRRPKPPQKQPLSLADATQALQEFLALRIELTMPPQIHQDALELADAHGLAAAYDAHYLALARLLGCELWTADKQLVNAVAGKLPFVRWIGDYRST